ncbi:o-succinylbenzoate synthase [Chryseosolibacter indicus]|uniref:O-succinylbenzoate synthase n=1 Tax=Chryseosolibacter indicus TaxID=2782351 RepID=A0ABS5VXX6_9BACT|nr:o-succinylbenzoate synthase [Chryseosolibacter indicus]MBT1704851.1 o-succinylbenzoate synthase [Chryseosolibacter indicus]
MPLQAKYFKKTFQFNFKARTSRGAMDDKTSWFINIWDDKNPSVKGIGECGPLPGLSIDHKPDLEEVIKSVISKLPRLESVDLPTLSKIVPPANPSILFAFETALLDLNNGGKRIIYNNDFIAGKGLPINGLIWMGDMNFMMDQVSEKIEKGFTCIKLKVGGLDFDKECDIISSVRKKYAKDVITIRLDANGAFKTEDVHDKLDRLSKFDIHSIEQPIKPGMAEMEELCMTSPIPIAFDEELIGKTTTAEKTKLLQKLKPQYIILKPTLHGGLSGTAEWISIAESLNIGWWITSALESNIGLNAICQFTANYDIRIPQGLGTGAIYTNNFESPLKVEKGYIYLKPDLLWQEIQF